METHHSLSKVNASRATASIWGFLVNKADFFSNLFLFSLVLLLLTVIAGFAHDIHNQTTKQIPR